MKDMYTWSPRLAIVEPTAHADRWLIMGPHDEAPLLLNDSAAFLWELFEEPNSIEDAVGFISSSMQAPRDQVMKDVVTFVDFLSGSGHLTQVAASSR